MLTVKVSRSDGLHCFYCNVRVAESDTACPGCGRSFSESGEPEPVRPSRIGRRIRMAVQGRRRGYRLAAIVLLVSIPLLVVFFRSGRPAPLLLPRPEAVNPDYSLLATWETPLGRLERLSVAALVRPGLQNDSLRTALDWLIYSALADYNGRRGRRVRVVWAYLLEDSLARIAEWRAMAIWADSLLPETQRPAGSGRDAFRRGPVQYNFTNPLHPGPTG